jgi:zinc transport system permease protein
MLSPIASLVLMLADTFGTTAGDVRAVIAILLVSLACGLVGGFIVGHRMAFFSDAMAHTAFAGVALGVLTLILTVRPVSPLEAEDHDWIILAVMITFGVLVGIAIAFVRERTGLSSDAVIGVFFAFAVGFGAMIIPEVNRRVKFDPEQFLFGSAVYATEADLAGLMLVAMLAALFVMFRFNALTLAGFNASLARTRSMPIRLNSYLFVILLSLIVNVSIKAVGVLLINALLIVPAAASANVARNVRQLFLGSITISIAAGLGGYMISRFVMVPLPGGRPIELRPAGTIIVLAVMLFFMTAIIAWVRGRRIHGGDCAC